MKQKFEEINREYQQRRTVQQQKHQDVINYIKTSTSNQSEQLSPVQQAKLECLLEDVHERPIKAEVYYCTSEGKVYGELTVTKHRLLFEPADTKENSYLIKQPEVPRRTFVDFIKGNIR